MNKKRRNARKKHKKRIVRLKARRHREMAKGKRAGAANETPAS